MTRMVRLGWWLPVLLLWPSAADAQVVVRRFGGSGGGPGTQLLNVAPAEYGVREWRAGQWVRYSISQDLGGPMPMVQFRTISVVGRRGEEYWVESGDEFAGMASGQGPVRKVLVPFGPITERVGAEVYVMSPDSAVRRETLLRSAPGARTRALVPEGWTRVGEESLTTPAGPFRAVHWRKGAEELWTSAEAGPIGLVRYRSADAEIELAGRGESGARSRIPFGGTER